MADDYSRSPNPHRLYRDKRVGVISGVCAGVADYFGADVALVRIGWLFGLVFFTPFAVMGYIAMAILLPVKPETAPHLEPEEERFWRGVSHRPETTFSNIRYRFRDMEERLADIERVVTSDEWRLRRQFREIE